MGFEITKFFFLISIGARFEVLEDAAAPSDLIGGKSWPCMGIPPMPVTACPTSGLAITGSLPPNSAEVVGKWLLLPNAWVLLSTSVVEFGGYKVFEFESFRVRISRLSLKPFGFENGISDESFPPERLSSPYIVRMPTRCEQQYHRAQTKCQPRSSMRPAAGTVVLAVKAIDLFPRIMGALDYRGD